MKRLSLPVIRARHTLFATSFIAMTLALGGFFIACGVARSGDNVSSTDGATSDGVASVDGGAPEDDAAPSCTPPAAADGAAQGVLGEIDPTFGEGGTAFVPIPSEDHNYVQCLVSFADGTLGYGAAAYPEGIGGPSTWLGQATANGAPLVSQLSGAGALDSCVGDGQDGIVLVLGSGSASSIMRWTPKSGFDSAFTHALPAPGPLTRLVDGTYIVVTPSATGVTLVGFGADGTASGTIVLPGTDSTFVPQASAPRPGGGVVIAGVNGASTVFVAATNAVGLDPSFGSGGIASIPVPSSDLLLSVAVDGASGEVLLAETPSAKNTNPGPPTLTRLAVNGAVRASSRLPGDFSGDVIADPNGGALVAVTISSSVASFASLVRIFADGGVDPFACAPTPPAPGAPGTLTLPFFNTGGWGPVRMQRLPDMSVVLMTYVCSPSAPGSCFETTQLVHVR